MISFMEWIIRNWIEICGAGTGMIYLYFSIRQHIFTWPVGLVTSLFYIAVFFNSKFYADMALQVYYVGISIYGWQLWIRGNATSNELRVSATSVLLWSRLFITFLAIFLIIVWILSRFTDSPVPGWDAFTTSLSIVATWMLARKKIENWIIWVIVDFVSLILYLWKGLYPTALLFVVYTVLAVVGYYSWKKEIKNQKWIPVID